MSLNESVLIWTPKTSDLGFKFSVTILMTNIYTTCPEYYEFFIIPQPRLEISIPNLQLYYGKPYRETLQINELTYFKISMFHFSLTSSIIGLEIDSNFGVITWDNPNSNSQMNVTLTLDGSYYVEDSCSQIFLLILVNQSMTPSFTQGIPLQVSNKYANSSELWTLTVKCTCPLSNTSMFLDSSSIVYDYFYSALEWTPPVVFCDSGLVNLTCECTNFGTFSSYSFDIAPLNSQDPYPTCQNALFNITYKGFFSHQIQYNWVIRDFSLKNIQIYTIQNNFIGMTLYKHGFMHWNPALRPVSNEIFVEIDDSSKINTCSMLINFTNFTDKPQITSQNFLFCNFPPCNTEITTKGDYSLITVNETENLQQLNNSLFKWSPPFQKLYEIVNFNASNEGGSDSQRFLLCQNSGCRQWPVITSILSSFCDTFSNELVCKYLLPSTILNITITGRNFGTSAEVMVGNKLCEIIFFRDTEIQCTLPPPTFGLSVYLVVVHRLDLDMYSPAKTIKYIHYSSTIPEIFVPDLDPLIIVPDLNGTFRVPITGNFLFKSCTCNSGDIGGKFMYKWSGLAYCDFQGLASQNYTLNVCCFGNCSSLVFEAVSDLNLELISQSTVSSHGQFPVTLTYSYTGTCIKSYILFKIGDQILRPSNPCSFTSTLIVPAQNSSAFSLLISISLNSGLSFSSQTINLTLSGYCSVGEYLYEGICTACPKGFRCDSVFDGFLSFFYSPKPCDLGYFGDELGQSECKICPVGFQCFCRGLSEPVPCDAGFVCDEEGLIKRWQPCPEGSYCLEGTSTLEAGDSGSPQLCPEGSYCLSGVFTGIVNNSDPYSPRDCDVGANCPPGSSNPEGVIECEIGYFCKSGLFDTSNTDIFQYSGQCTLGKCECPTGYYCPSSQLQNPIMCPKGKYQPKYAQSVCEQCPQGFYCPWSDSVSPKQAEICDMGNRCPLGQSAEIQCSLGQFQNETGQTICRSCPAGTYAPSLGTVNCTLCEQGYYCPDVEMSSPLQCPSQYYCFQLGINAQPDNITQDSANVYPSNLTETATKKPQQCPVAYYCPLKSVQPTACPIGSFQNASGAVDCFPCPNGKLCAAVATSVPKACPAGYFCEENKQTACPAGYFCYTNTETSDPNSTTTYRPWPCPPGTFCAGGNTEGFQNASDPYSAQNCSVGLYNSEWAQSSCTNCPAGSECLASGLVWPSLCPSGTYRPFDLAQVECIECPEGTYNPSTGSASLLACLNCDAGIVCNVSGASDQKSSYPCPAGYYCPAGTSRNTRNDHPCPVGYFCYQGTASLEQALLNPCPAGRFCDSATAVLTFSNCTDPSNCTIGTICTSDFYCPQGTTYMVPCPNGTTSGLGCVSVSQCNRTSEVFYNITVVSTAPVISTVPVTEFSYYEFDLHFLNNITNATMPQDYQMLININFPSRYRRLNEESANNLLVSHTNYGTKLGVPLIYSSRHILSSGANLKLGIQMNVNAEINFIFQFLNSTYNNEFGWDHFEVPVDSMTNAFQRIDSQGFVCVLTRSIGKLIEDPVNLYKTLYLNNQNVPINENPEFETRYAMSLIANNSNLQNNSAPLQNTTSIWTITNKNTWTLTYLPYITNCYPVYGANLPLNQMIKDSRCNLNPFPQIAMPLSFYSEVTGDSCNYELTCDFIVDINNYKRSLRWYEAYTEANNAHDPNKLSIPVFYISKNLVPKAVVTNATVNDFEADFELTPVNAVIIEKYRSWATGDVPTKVSLNLGYFQPDSNTSQILYAQIIFDDIQNSLNFSNTLYNFTFNYYPLQWIDCFNLNAFHYTDYIFILFVLSSFFVGCTLTLSVFSYLIRPKSWKISGFSLVFLNFLDCLKGFFLGSLPVLVAVFSIYLTLYYGAALDYEVGNYTDTVPVTDTSAKRVVFYRMGRFGVSLFVVGFSCLSWGVDLMIPVKSLSGLGYESEKIQQIEQQDNPKNQGPLCFSLLFSIILCILLDTIGQLPPFTYNYYIIYPILLGFEYVLNLVCLLTVKDFLYSVPFKLAIRIGMSFMILNCETLEGMMGSLLFMYTFRIIVQGFLEKYLQIYVVSYFLKYFRKMTFKAINDDVIMTSNILSINELSEKSLNFLINYFTSLMSLSIYLFYENTSYEMVQVHYFYFFTANLFLLGYEPITAFGVNLIRLSRDKSYLIADLYSKIQENYKRRSEVWALSLSIYEDSSFKISSECENQCKVGWSSQYYCILTLLGFGVYLSVFAVKLWEFASYAPFFDLWMTVIAGITYAGCLFLKYLSIVIGKKVIWKIPRLQFLYQRGIDGNIIRDRSDFISDIILQNEIRKLKSDEDKRIISVGDITQEVLDVLKETSSTDLALIKLFRVFSELDLGGKLDIDKIFENIKNSTSAFSIKHIDEKIGNTLDPYLKINLIREKQEREGIKLPMFPYELRYKWESSDDQLEVIEEVDEDNASSSLLFHYD